MLLRLCRAAAVFAFLGVVGPAFRMAVPTGPDPFAAFVYDLTWFTWPTHAIAVIEVNVGHLQAFLASAGANVVVFLVLGALLGLLGGSRVGVWAFRALLVSLLVYWALFGAGYDPAFVNYGALCVALVFYLSPALLLQSKGWLGVPGFRKTA